MKKIYLYLAAFVLAVNFTTGCSRDETDEIKPEINMDFEGSFPTDCDTLWFGEAFTFRARFSDNLELGSFSIEIHDNFDHHAHSTSVIQCEPEPVKKAVNPFHLIRDFPLPEKTTYYETDVVILIPEGNNEGDFDEGDYHMFISLTDREGWSAQRGISIKIYSRNE